MRNFPCRFHPDDEQARRVGQPWGKTECWYVAHAKPGSQIALGLKPGVTVANLEKAIREKRAEELLNWLNIFTGDMIYVSGGTVHTLGPGSVIIERSSSRIRLIVCMITAGRVNCTWRRGWLR